MGNVEDRESSPQGEEGEESTEQYANVIDETTKRMLLKLVQQIVEETVCKLGKRMEERLQRIETRLMILEERMPFSPQKKNEEGGLSQEIYMDLEHFMKAMDDDDRARISSVDPPKKESNPETVSPTYSAFSFAIPICGSSTSSPTVPTSARRISSGTSPIPPNPMDLPAPATPQCASPKHLDDLEQALMEAAQEKRVKDIRELLNAGADVNARDVNGWSALIWASGQGDADAVALLLEKGADVNAQNSVGWTALHFAGAKDASGRCAALLAEAGADLHSRNEAGSTPLHEAAARGNGEAVRVLVAAGADRGAENANGRTPLNVAMGDLVRSILRR